MRIMGVDLGTRKIAYAIWEDGVLIEADAYEAQEHWQRPKQLMDISDWIYEVVENTEPDHVFIEDTLVGNNVKYSIQLAQVMGAVLSSLANLGMQQLFEIYLVNVSRWKADVIGSGRADKERIRSWLLERDSAYSVLCGNDQDRFDAACIGYYGILIAERAEAVELAGLG